MLISNSCSFPEGWTKENLMRPHKSVPYNPDIANTFYKAGYIEAWGRGIDKIIAGCREIGAKVPDYDIAFGDITIRFEALKLDYTTDKPSGGGKSGGKSGGKNGGNDIEYIVDTENLSNKEQAILRQVIYDGSRTADQMSQNTGITKRSVERILKGLKDKGIIMRVGSSRKGWWRVNQ